MNPFLFQNTVSLTVLADRCIRRVSALVLNKLSFWLWLVVVNVRLAHLQTFSRIKHISSNISYNVQQCSHGSYFSATKKLMTYLCLNFKQSVWFAAIMNGFKTNIFCYKTISNNVEFTFLETKIFRKWLCCYFFKILFFME